MADSEDLVAIILSSLEAVSGIELCILSTLLASESSLQLQRLWLLLASPSRSLSIISFLDTLSHHHRRLLLVRVTLRLVCRITDFLADLAACASDKDVPDNTIVNPLHADLAHHSHQCAGQSVADSLLSKLDMEAIPALVRETMDSTIANPMYADMANQFLPFAALSFANSSHTGSPVGNGRLAGVDASKFCQSLEDVESSEKADRVAIAEDLRSFEKPGVGIANARFSGADIEDPCRAGSDVAKPRHAHVDLGNINIAGACVTEAGAPAKKPCLEPSKVKIMSVDVASSRCASMSTCTGSSNPRFADVELFMDMTNPSCEIVKDDVSLPWGETDAAFLFLFLWETQEQECQEAMHRWCIDPFIYHLLIVQDMALSVDDKSKSSLIWAPKWRERLQQYLLQNVLQVGYGFPGMMASTNFPASLSAYIDTIGRFQRILRSMSGEDSSEQRSPPASAATLHSLPTSIICLSSEEKGQVCIICKEELEPSSVASQLPCLHVYHWDCILSWLKQRNNCPVCRHELPTDDYDYELQRKIQILKERAS